MIISKRKLIALSVAVIIFAALVSTWYFLPEQNKIDYYSMEEVLFEGLHQQNISKNKYEIKDKVIYIKEIKIPAFSIEEYKGEKGKYGIKFNTSGETNLLAIGFKSLSHQPVFFSEKSNYTFEEGSQKTFNLNVKKYPSIDYVSVASEPWYTTEPVFNYFLLDIYSSQINFNEIEIADISKDVSVNNQTNSFHCNLTFNSVSDFHPYPVKWKDVNLTMSEDFREEHFADYYIKVYHEDTYLGRLESNDSGLDKFIEPGDRIEVAGFNYSYGYGDRLQIQLETSHPSNIDYELSEFPISPYYKIDFEE